MEFNFKIFLVFLFYKDVICGAQKEYCNIEMFEATCAADEVIVMTNARYGRMRIGRCNKVDLGFLGCGADVMYIFDEHCSGKQTCNIQVGDKGMGARSTCSEGLLQYLEAAYTCAKVHNFEVNNCGGVSEVDIHASSSQELIISDAAIESNCIQINKAWKLKANNGQRLNINLIDFKYDATTDSDEVYGKLVDMQSGKVSTFGQNTRFQQLLNSAGNAVEVTFYSRAHRFALNVSVLGCLDMSPPDGAWMTRDGDVMEVGCHSGSKSWTLRCENSHWVGAVGYCGTDFGTDVNTVKTETELNISINVIVFSICSLVLLFSSIIFLIGALLLKRKPPKFHRNMENTGAFPLPYNSNTLDYFKNEPNMGTLQEPQAFTMPIRQAMQVYENGSGHYKSLQGKDVQQSRDSVKCFVLEDNVARQPMLND